MNRLFVIIYILLTISSQPATAMDKTRQKVLSKVFSFQETYNPEIKGHTMQVYTKHYYQTYRRNLGLWLIPSMYTIARGQRTFMSEQYGQLTIKGLKDIERKRQVYYTTIPHNRTTMSVLDNFALPDLYQPTLYGNHILSPVCRENRLYYKYKVSIRNNNQARIDFRPRLGNNTQLVSGTIIADINTGRILNLMIWGEYDMIEFFTTYRQMGQQELNDSTVMPSYCKTNISFKFLGNHITSNFTSVFNCPKQLADSIDVKGDRAMMDSLRPISLAKEEASVYERFDSLNAIKNDTTKLNSINQQSTLKALKDFGWDLGTYLMSSHGANAKKYRVRFSPLIEPQLISYSHSRGLSYKINLSAEYYLNNNSALTFTPYLGYNFKIKKVYSYLPFRYVYNKQKNNFIELSWDIGNRIGNSSVLDELKDERGNLPELDMIKLDEFNDNEVRLINSMQINSWLHTEAGLVYHNRQAVNKSDMRRFDKPTVYQSIAPTIGVTLQPIKSGPMFSVNYERAIKSKHMQQAYERWESSVQQRFSLPSTKAFNLRVGAGLYTNRNGNYFMDFSNFCVNNLPGGWEDDWAGDFQLLDSRLYNISKYYISSNISYESPLMMASFIPMVGRYVEQERLYWSGLLIEYNRPYHEFGYGLSTRFFSIGAFAGFNLLDYQHFGIKFTFELFHRW